MMRTQGIVFDTDGVLIDSEELHAHAKRIAFAHAGIALSDADLRSYVGRSDAVMIDEIGARYGLTDGQRPLRPKILLAHVRLRSGQAPGTSRPAQFV
jgi:beta-phosphoglucomutase-like phosphatase (HAD superfamily)